jgi:hypothetical protein
VSSNRNRKKQREIRVLARELAISYQAALRSVDERNPPDLESALRLEETLLDAGIDLVEILRGDYDVGDRGLQGLAALDFDRALRRAKGHGLGLLSRVARLSGIEPPSVSMPVRYPRELVRDATAYAQSLGDDPEWTDLDAPLEAAMMFDRRPRALIGAAVMEWLDAGHPDRFARLAGGTWRGQPVSLPGDSWGAVVLDELDAISAVAMVDAEAVSATRTVLVRVLIEEALS